jgi:hypothetical protein
MAVRGISDSQDQAATTMLRCGLDSVYQPIGDHRGFQNPHAGAGQPHSTDWHHPDGIPHKREYFRIWDPPGDYPLPHECHLDARALPSELSHVTIHPLPGNLSSQIFQLSANLDPCLALRREEEEEEEEEEELLPEGEGSMNAAITQITMAMSVDPPHSTQPSMTVAATSTECKRKASLDILQLDRPMSTWVQRQKKDKAKELPKASSSSTSVMSGTPE